MYDNAHKGVMEQARDHHPRVYSLLAQNGSLDRQPKSITLLEFLAQTITSQQLSTAAAETIWQRIADLVALKKIRVHDLFTPYHLDELRACGVSRQKLKAIYLLRESIVSGKLSERNVRNASYEEVHRLITSQWGLGRWSADMTAMFFCDLPDVWPSDDGAILRGSKALLPEEPDIADAVKRYMPHRSYLALQIWHGLDTGTLIP